MGVRNGFTFALQFVLLIFVGLGGVNENSLSLVCLISASRGYPTHKVNNKESCQTLLIVSHYISVKFNIKLQHKIIIQR